MLKTQGKKRTTKCGPGLPKTAKASEKVSNLYNFTGICCAPSWIKIALCIVCTQVNNEKTFSSDNIGKDKILPQVVVTHAGLHNTMYLIEMNSCFLSDSNPGETQAEIVLSD